MTDTLWAGPDALIPLLVPVATLSPLPGNPRRGDVASVVASYRQFGQRKPIVVRAADMTVTAGNHQLLAALELGWTSIAAVVTDDDEATAQAFALADNRTHDLGTYDTTALAELLTSVRDSDASLLAATGYTDADIAALLAAEPAPPAALTDIDDLPATPATPITQLGDVWLLGPHRVLCGDATSRHDASTLMRDNLAHLVLTDPPYGVDYEGGTNRKKRDRLLGDDRDTFADALPIAHQFSTPDAALYLWFAGSRGLAAYTAAAQAGYTIRAMIIWHKLNAHYGSFMAQYMPKHEPLLYAHKTGQPPKWRGPTNEVTVWEYDQPARNDLHPTQKPVAPLARAIQNSTDPGDIVLDPFAGSGSTLIAAHTTNRTAHLIELDPRYVDVIARRYQQHTGTTPILEATGQPHDFTEGTEAP